MIDAVIVFAVINVVFEMVLLSMIPPKIRLRLLGSKGAQTALHLVVMGFVLAVHWGTLIGTMSGFLSFILSMFTTAMARIVFGYIKDDTYRRGIVGYKVAELL